MKTAEEAGERQSHEGQEGHKVEKQSDSFNVPYMGNPSCGLLLYSGTRRKP